jgi:hypothetical protein
MSCGIRGSCNLFYSIRRFYHQLQYTIMTPVARIWFPLLLSLPVMTTTGNSSALFAKTMEQTWVTHSYKKTITPVTVKYPATNNNKKNTLPSYSKGADTLISYQLAPDLTVKSKVMGPGRIIVQVSFYYGESLVYTGTVMQTSPIIITTDDVIVGFLQINKGATITLGIPSRIQPGQILLRAQFITKDHPSTTFSGLIATWPL